MDDPIEQAEEAMRASRWHEAVQYWQAALDAAEEPAPVVYARMGKAQRHARALDEAEMTLRVGMERYPAFSALFTEYAEVAMTRQDWTEAARRWQEVVDRCREATPTGVFVRMSTFFCQQGRYEEAERVISQGREWHPDEVALSMEFAEIAMFQKKWPEAIKRWQDLNR